MQTIFRVIAELTWFLFQHFQSLKCHLESEDGELPDSDDSSGEIVDPPETVTIFPDTKPKKRPIEPEPLPEPQRPLPGWLAAKRQIPCKYFKWVDFFTLCEVLSDKEPRKHLNYRAGYCQFGGKCHYFHDRPDSTHKNADEKKNTGEWELFPENKEKPPSRPLSRSTNCKRPKLRSIF